MAVVGIEEQAEQAIKNALSARYSTVVPALDPVPKIRSWTLDDETDEDDEARDFPCVVIVSHPAVPNGYQQSIYNIPFEISVQTHLEDDPKRSNLVAIYKETRWVLEVQTVTVSGNAAAFVIGDGGTSGIDEPFSFMNIVGTLKACG